MLEASLKGCGELLDDLERELGSVCVAEWFPGTGTLWLMDCVDFEVLTGVLLPGGWYSLGGGGKLLLLG